MCRYRKTLNFMVMENIFYGGDHGAIPPVVKPNAVYLLLSEHSFVESALKFSGLVVDPTSNGADTTSKAAGSTATPPEHAPKGLSQEHLRTTILLTFYVSRI